VQNTRNRHLDEQSTPTPSALATKFSNKEPRPPYSPYLCVAIEHALTIATEISPILARKEFPVVIIHWHLEYPADHKWQPDEPEPWPAIEHS
jgi:hypothetical protein